MVFQVHGHYHVHAPQVAVGGDAKGQKDAAKAAGGEESSSKPEGLPVSSSKPTGLPLACAAAAVVAAVGAVVRHVSANGKKRAKEAKRKAKQAAEERLCHNLGPPMALPMGPMALGSVMGTPAMEPAPFSVGLIRSKSDGYAAQASAQQVDDCFPPPTKKEPEKSPKAAAEQGKGGGSSKPHVTFSPEVSFKRRQSDDRSDNSDKTSGERQSDTEDELTISAWAGESGKWRAFAAMQDAATSPAPPFLAGAAAEQEGQPRAHLPITEIAKRLAESGEEGSASEPASPGQDGPVPLPDPTGSLSATQVWTGLQPESSAADTSPAGTPSPAPSPGPPTPPTGTPGPGPRTSSASRTAPEGAEAGGGGGEEGGEAGGPRPRSGTEKEMGEARAAAAAALEDAQAQAAQAAAAHAQLLRQLSDAKRTIEVTAAQVAEASEEAQAAQLKVYLAEDEIHQLEKRAARNQLDHDAPTYIS